MQNDSSVGAGIKIGILDGGIVDKNNSNFAGATLIIRDKAFFTETVSDHATQVAAVAHSMAPGATLLSVEACGELGGEIDWLLNNGANVINMSFASGDPNDYGSYEEVSSYCDYVARNAWVTFVGSAGNEGEGSAKVTPPNGYNNVTVGACYSFGTRCPFSSYKEDFTINFPNLVAPGSGYLIPTFSKFVSGTSYSAPLVTGAIAVLMQKNSSLKSAPASVLSILMASAKRIDSYAVTTGFNDEIGTGMLNVPNAIASINNTTRFTVVNDSVGDFVSTRSVYLTAGQRIRIAFASIVNMTSAVSTDLVTDYDLYLYNSAGVAQLRCAGTHNNEFIDYVVRETGIYTIKIKQFSAKKTTRADYCSYSYFICP